MKEFEKNADRLAIGILKAFYPNNSFVPPVDVLSICHYVGTIPKSTADVHEDGLYIKDGNEHYIIINNRQTEIHQRVSAAKLLGSYYYFNYPDNFKSITENDNNFDVKDWRNRFAQSLLMPRSAVLSLYTRGKYPEEIARTFHVTTNMINQVLTKSL